jgi:hypothetical protein
MRDASSRELKPEVVNGIDDLTVVVVVRCPVRHSAIRVTDDDARDTAEAARKANR